jgi:transposase InsO family protein
MNESHLINTLLQRGVRRTNGYENRFNGLSRRTEIVETVSARSGRLNTSLKQGVNETCTPIITI